MKIEYLAICENINKGPCDRLIVFRYNNKICNWLMSKYDTPEIIHGQIQRIKTSLQTETYILSTKDRIGKVLAGSLEGEERV